MVRTFRRLAIPAALLLVPIGLVGCGESSEEKATASVCSSTKEIRAQLTKLSSLSISSKAPEEIKAAAEVMEKQAGEIKESAGNLPAASKQPVESAESALKTELATLAAKSLAAAVKSSGSLETVLKESEPALKTGVAALASSYKQAYESLKCS